MRLIPLLLPDPLSPVRAGATDPTHPRTILTTNPPFFQPWHDIFLPNYHAIASLQGHDY